MPMLVAEEVREESVTRGVTVEPNGEDRMVLVEFIEKS